MADETTQESIQEMDMDSAVSDIASNLGLKEEPTTEPIDEPIEEEVAADEPSEPEIDEPEVEKTEHPRPQSWAKDTTEIWDALPEAAKVQIEKREKQMLDGLEQYKGDSGFGKQMREITEPYKAFITSQGVDAPRAVQFLLNAHYRLSTAQPAQRQQYFDQLAKSYGVEFKKDEQQIDPALKALQEKISSLESSMTAREQAAYEEARSRVALEVQTFASDPKNQYFDECSEDIAAYIKAGHTLEDAYAKAVWANPITRAKELARTQKESETKLRGKAKSDAEAARKAASTNVRTRDTNKAPTEPSGKLFSAEHDAEMLEIIRRQQTH